MLAVASGIVNYSELAACLTQAEGLRARKLCVTAYVSLPSNQTGNKNFVCSLSGSQLMWQIYLYLPGSIGNFRYQNPIPKF